MLEDRYYMRQTPFQTGRSATVMLLLVNALAFVLECIFYGYPPHFRHDNLLALSWEGLRHGYVWQLLTFQFLHGGLLHLLFNCWAIFVFGRELEMALGVKRFLTLYFSSGIMGGLAQALAGGLALQFPDSSWALHFVGPTVGASAGALGLLAAFAALYPERPLVFLLFFIIPISMRAKFLLAFAALIALFGILVPTGNLADVAHLGGILTGVVYARYAIYWSWPRLSFRRRGPRRGLGRVFSGKAAARRAERGAEEEELAPEEFLSKEVDPILDKISAQGIQSLTPRERRILQAAREKMAKR